MAERRDAGDGVLSRRLEDLLTRRRFVAAGAAFGAAVVWTSQSPFTDAALGQMITTLNGTTGTTGPTSGYAGATNQGTQQPPPCGSTGPQSSFQYQPPAGASDSSGSPPAQPAASEAKHVTSGRLASVEWLAKGDKSGRIGISLRSSAPGHLSVLCVSGTPAITYAQAEHRLSGSGATSLELTPTLRGHSLLRRMRRRHQRVSVRIRITFAPDTGKSVAQERTIRVPAS